MLVLTRKLAESIKIGDDIVIKVIQTGKGKVKLGIEAPAHVRVLRAELTEFATAPAVAVGADHGHAGLQREIESTSESLSEDECYFDLCEEHAVEVEDMMMCVGAIS